MIQRFERIWRVGTFLLLAISEACIAISSVKSCYTLILLVLMVMAWLIILKLPKHLREIPQDFQFSRLIKTARIMACAIGNEFPGLDGFGNIELDPKIAVFRLCDLEMMSRIELCRYFRLLYGKAEYWEWLREYWTNKEVTIELINENIEKANLRTWINPMSIINFAGVDASTAIRERIRRVLGF